MLVSKYKISSENKTIKIQKKMKKLWPGRDLNTQPSDLESDALPLRYGVRWKDGPWIDHYIQILVIIGYDW